MPVQSEREELAKLLRDQFNVHSASAGSLTFWELAHAVLAHGYRRVSADPDTVERVAEAIHAPACGCDGSLHSPDEWDAAFCGWARAATNAIGGTND